MTLLDVERISLQVPGLSPEEGRRLAVLVADGLVSAVPSRAGDAKIGSLSVRTAGAGAPLDELAQHILDGITAELRRNL
jgi:hypothetical protein